MGFYIFNWCQSSQTIEHIIPWPVDLLLTLFHRILNFGEKGLHLISSSSTSSIHLVNICWHKQKEQQTNELVPEDMPLPLFCPFHAALCIYQWVLHHSNSIAIGTSLIDTRHFISNYIVTSLLQITLRWSSTWKMSYSSHIGSYIPLVTTSNSFKTPAWVEYKLYHVFV